MVDKGNFCSGNFVRMIRIGGLDVFDKDHFFEETI